MLNRIPTLLTKSFKNFSSTVPFLNTLEPLSALKLKHTYFSLWNIDPPSFRIDKLKLQQRYRVLQKQLHPDKNVGLSKEEQLKRAELSAWVNQGYFTLKNDFERALYFMRLRNIEIIQENEKWEDPELTMRVFDIREGIEEASTLTELEDVWKEQNEARIEKLTSQIEEALSKWEESQNIGLVKRLLIELRYELTIQEAIDKREREFEGLV